VKSMWLILCVAVCLSCGCGKSEDEILLEDCQDTMKRLLKAPTTAVFSDCEVLHIKGFTCVRGKLTANNEFNAPITDYWQITYRDGQLVYWHWGDLSMVDELEDPMGSEAKKKMMGWMIIWGFYCEGKLDAPENKEMVDMVLAEWGASP